MPAFKRSPPPLALQWGLGLFVHGIFRPLVRSLETVGGAERALGSMSARRDKQLAKKNPFRSYVPGQQDVFVMTYAKSGTNWMMQIAHPAHPGHGEYDHLHDVVPWPDTQSWVLSCGATRSRRTPLTGPRRQSGSE